MITISVWFFWLLAVLASMFVTFVAVALSKQDGSVGIIEQSARIRQIYFRAVRYYAEREQISGVTGPALEALSEASEVGQMDEVCK